MLVMMKLMAFMLPCIGIQIMWDGWSPLNAIPYGDQNDPNIVPKHDHRDKREYRADDPTITMSR